MMTILKNSIIVIMMSMAALQAQETQMKITKTLIYENNFDSFADIDDWVIEGPAKTYLVDNKMMIIPDAQQYVYRKWEDCGRRVLDAKKEYYAAVKEGLEKTNPDMVKKMYNENGVFAGGHTVCWNKAFETAGDYCVEYDFKPLSPVGLAIIFFSAKGCDGSDVLSESLKERNGIFSQYLTVDTNSYHISYWANNAAVGKRGTCNLRKNVGAHCLANGIDPSVKNLDYSKKTFEFETYRVQLLKIKNNIKFSINGEIAIDYTDNRFNNIVADEGIDTIKEKNVDTGEVLQGGRIGLRQMVGLIGQYDNFKAYNITLSETQP